MLDDIIEKLEGLDVFSNIQQWLGGAFEVVAEWAKSSIEWAKHFIVQVWESLKDWLTPILNDAEKYIKQTIHRLVIVFDPSTETGRKNLRDLIDRAKSKGTMSIDKMKELSKALDNSEKSKVAVNIDESTMTVESIRTYIADQVENKHDALQQELDRRDGVLVIQNEQ